MNQLDLAVQERRTQSKNESRRMRRAGRIPAVIYGQGKDAASVSIDAVEFFHLGNRLHSSTILNLKQGEGMERAIIREIQRDPVSEQALHIDFLRVDVAKPIVVSVPVHGVGVPRGAKIGGVLEHVTRQVQVRVLPLEVPEHLDIDISDMGLGHSLHVSDLKVPEGVVVVTPGHETLFIVQVPRGMEAEAKGPAAEGAAPAAAAPAGKGAPAAKGGPPAKGAPAAKGAPPAKAAPKKK